jgi:eukaryotic-like serine/threonine-protein kinase
MNKPIPKKAGSVVPPANAVTASDPKRTETYKPEPAPKGNLPQLPGYEVIGTLGKGGMGVVYHAKQVKLNRQVALKMVLGDTPADSKEIIRFLAEAEAAAAIDHPNVVRVYDYGEHEGRPYLALEYLPGGSFADTLKSGRMKIAAAARFVEKVARGVAAAHELGIVHRDLKPGNVLLDAAGQPKVADFGLAKRGLGADLTQSQAVMGTPAYMSPEQAVGKTKFVGPPADVWALGVILYECLAGQRPYQAGTTQELLAKLIHGDPDPLRPRVPKLPRDLELVCMKCLSKNPADRYASAGELVEDLRRFSAGEPVSVKPAGSVEIAVKWARRKPTLAASMVLGVLTVLLGGLTAVAGLNWLAAERERKIAEVARNSEEGQKLLAQQSRDVAEKAKDVAEKAKAELVAEREMRAVWEYGRTIQVAYDSWRDNDVGATVALLETTRPDLRGWEYRYVHRLAHRDALTLYPGLAGSVSLSPDGAKVLTVGNDSVAKIWDAKTGATLFELKPRGMYSASFNPDGTVIIGFGSVGSPPGATGVNMVWDAKTGTELFALKGHTKRLLSASFSADGTRIVTTSEDNTARIWNSATGAQLSVLKIPSDVISAALTADGERVVTVSRNIGVKIWNAKAGAELLAQKRNQQTEYSAARASFSADGSRIVTVNHSDFAATVWDAQTGAESLVLRGHTGSVASASFNGDGTRIVTASYDQTAKIWDAKTGVELRTLRGHIAGVASAAFSRDGKSVITASIDLTAKVWDLNSGDDPLNVGVRKGGYWGAGVKGHAAFFSPDGTKIITLGGTPNAKVWDARTGIELHALPKLGWNYEVPASFSGNGNRIITYDMMKDGMAARVWDVKSGKSRPPLLTLKGHSMRTAAFSPDGTRIVTAGASTAKVWETKYGVELLTLRGHVGRVASASFSPDGTRIITCDEATTKVWDSRPVNAEFMPKGGGQVK